MLLFFDRSNRPRAWHSLQRDVSAERVPLKHGKEKFGRCPAILIDQSTFGFKGNFYFHYFVVFVFITLLLLLLLLLFSTESINVLQEIFNIFL